MRELLNVRFSFLCRTTHTNSEAKHPLVLRIIQAGERKDIFTGLYCKKEQWNSKTGRLHRLSKECSVINDNLDLIQRKAYDAFEGLKYSVSAFNLGIFVRLFAAPLVEFIIMSETACPRCLILPHKVKASFKLKPLIIERVYLRCTEGYTLSHLLFSI